MKDELEMRNPLSEEYFNKVVDEDIECVKAVTFSTKNGKKRFVPEPEWIPVSERLPERDVDVLTYHRNESFCYYYVSWIDDYSGKWTGFIGSLSDEVLAWMPLPEPYQEEKE